MMLMWTIVTLAVAKDTFRQDDSTLASTKRDTVFRSVAPVQGPQEQQVRVDVGLTELPKQLFLEFSQDPVVLTCGIFLVGYVVGQLMVTRTDTKAEKPKPAKPAKELKPRRRLKSHAAVAINQKLMSLQSTDELLTYATTSLHTADIVNVVTAIHRCAKLVLQKGEAHVAQDPRLRLLLRALLQFLEEDLPLGIVSRAVGNTSWALAKMNFMVTEEDEPVLDRLQELFSLYADHFRPEELMNTVWAFTALGGETAREHARAVHVARALQKCTHRFSEFTLQQVIYFAWALARLLGFPSVRAQEDVLAGVRHYKRQILQVVSMQPGALTTKNISMISWAITYLHQRVETDDDVRGVLIAITTEAAQRDLRLFAPGELASIIWALNKCNVKHVTFFSSFTRFATQHGLAQYSSQDLANIVVTYVNLVSDDEFLTLLSSVVQASVASFNRLERSMVTAAFAQVPHIKAPRFP